MRTISERAIAIAGKYKQSPNEKDEMFARGGLYAKLITTEQGCFRVQYRRNV
jgi:hypothetical protein